MATSKKAPATKAAPAKKSTVVAKAAPAKKAVAKVAAKVVVEAPKAKPIKTAFNKTTLNAHLAETSGVDLKSVRAVMAALETAMLASLQKKAVGEFSLPGLVKVTALNVPATKARKGINPFTKEPTVFKAKPATVKLKARFFKKLKDNAVA